MSLKNKILSYIQTGKSINKHVLKSIEESPNYDVFRRLLIENRLVTEEELLLIFSKEFKNTVFRFKEIQGAL